MFAKYEQKIKIIIFLQKGTLTINTDDSGQIRGAEVLLGRLQPPQNISKSCGCSCHPTKLPSGGGIILDTHLESLRSILLRT